MANIVSIVPYKFLPAINGGHWGVIIIEKLLSVYNKVTTITTINNVDDKKQPFQLSLSLPDKQSRYIPFAGIKTILEIARQQKADYIFAHHHYMFFTAKSVAYKLKIPLYIRSHNIETLRFKSLGKPWWRIMFQYEKMAYKKADRIFFVTEEDKDWAVENFKIAKDKSVVMPFGIDFDKSPELPKSIKIQVANLFDVPADVPWLFFMGQLDYMPNEEAVVIIIRKILPILRKRNIAFQTVIFGKNLSAVIQEEIKQTAKNKDVIFVGFVPELAPVLSACDIMLNPMLSGGGVKTKVVESLAWNKTIVSTKSGAVGIEKAVCGEKLQICDDNDWERFADLVINNIQIKNQPQIPDRYFDYYYSKNIAERMQPFFK